MTVWLDPDDVAARLKIARRTAVALMHDMPHSVIGGTVKKRIRVSEASLDAWMEKQSVGNTIQRSGNCGSKRRLQRR